MPERFVSGGNFVGCLHREKGTDVPVLQKLFVCMGLHFLAHNPIYTL